MDIIKAVEQVLLNPIYLSNIEYEVESSGHPERKIKNHIADLEYNLKQLRHRLQEEEDYWKLKFIIHVHDTFKVEAYKQNSWPGQPSTHAAIARDFAKEFTNDEDLLNIILYHDENYALWKQFNKRGEYDFARLERLLNTIQDWNLFLIFTIVDGATRGKDREKLSWFINEVKNYKCIKIDESWITILYTNPLLHYPGSL